MNNIFLLNNIFLYKMNNKGGIFWQYVFDYQLMKIIVKKIEELCDV